MASHLERDYERYKCVVGAVRLKNIFKPSYHEAALIVLRSDHVKECQDALDKEIKQLAEALDRQAKGQGEGRETLMLAAEIDALKKAKRLIEAVADAEARKALPVKLPDAKKDDQKKDDKKKDDKKK
jgi:hypothetical protein